MTTNEIMANLELMKKAMDQNINTFSDSEDPVIVNSKDWCGLFSSWLDTLITKHWKEEEKMMEATMFLHMNERG